jgi:hypothetical protein
MEERRNMSDSDSSSEETLEESSTTRRLLEDIGGQFNLSLFYSILKDYKKTNVEDETKYLEFRDHIQKTRFDYVYCIKNTYLFVKFLEQCPKYREAVWFMKQYTKLKLTQPKVNFLEIMYVYSKVSRR